MRIGKASKPGSPSSFGWGLALLGMGSATGVLLGWVMRLANYGFEFTDEGFYLQSISEPALFSGSVYLFGFLYHPIFCLLNGDVAALRQANMLITFGLAWGLAMVILSRGDRNLEIPPFPRWVLASALASPSLVFFSWWFPTPGYNSLAFQGLLATSIGLALAEGWRGRAGLLGWILIGSGGWIVFMGKISAVPLVAAGAGIFLFVVRKRSPTLWFLSIGSFLALIVATALAIDGSVWEFSVRLREGMRNLRDFGGGYGLLHMIRMDGFRLSLVEILIFFILVCLVKAATVPGGGKDPRALTVSWAVGSGFLAFVFAVVANALPQKPALGQYKGLLLTALPLAGALSVFFREGGQSLLTVCRTEGMLAGVLAMWPYAFAFGSNNNYCFMGSLVGVFWIFAGMTVLVPLLLRNGEWRSLWPIAAGAQMATALILWAGLESPYRQPGPLWEFGSVTAVGPSGARLLVSSGFAKYIDESRAAALGAGFRNRDFVLDMTGRSPGLLFAWGARSLGQAWMIGGYPGSDLLAERALSRVSRDRLASSWVLTEPDGPRSLSSSVLERLGIILERDYRRVAGWEIPPGAGGQSERVRQWLWKPADRSRPGTTESSPASQTGDG